LGHVIRSVSSVCMSGNSKGFVGGPVRSLVLWWAGHHWGRRFSRYIRPQRFELQFDKSRSIMDVYEHRKWAESWFLYAISGDKSKCQINESSMLRYLSVPYAGCCLLITYLVMQAIHEPPSAFQNTLLANFFEYSFYVSVLAGYLVLRRRGFSFRETLRYLLPCGILYVIWLGYPLYS